MKFKELGKPEHPVIILLHGSGLSWWSVENAARLLMKQYHVIMPIIDGHGEDAETEFISVADSAHQLIRLIDRSCSGHVFALCGLSLGAQIAAQVLSERPEISEYAVLESVLVQPGHTRAREIPKVLMLLFHRLSSFRIFAKLWAKVRFIPNELFELYFHDTQKISLNSLIRIRNSTRDFHIPASLKDTRATVFLLVGSRESIEMKLSAGLLKKAIPNSRIVVARGMHHGELGIAHSAEYVDLLKQWFSEKLK